MTKQQLQAALKEQYIVVGTTIENKVGDTVIAAKTIDDLATKAMVYGLIK
jgi:hypothetical protein|nr:MAG TPA: hypothetical protein [Caudoviricetes sp.]